MHGLKQAVSSSCYWRSPVYVPGGPPTQSEVTSHTDSVSFCCVAANELAGIRHEHGQRKRGKPLATAILI